MGVIWEPNPSLYIFISICCFLSLLLSSTTTTTTTKSPFDHSPPPSHRHFLLLFSIASVMEGLWSVFGEMEMVAYGVGKDSIAASICVGYAASICVGSFLGLLSDSIGHKKACLVFCILHLVVGIWKRVTMQPSLWLASISLSLATSIFAFGFEAWLVIENEKQGNRQDTLSDAFWLMTFFESVSLISSQVLVNWLVDSNVVEGSVSSGTLAILLAIIAIICVSKGWKETPQIARTNEYKSSYAHVFSDKRIWLLAFTQASLQLSCAIFWILWAPTLVADGREAHLGLIYPCFLGARMLGSTTFPWLLSGPSSFRTEDCLVYAFIIMGITLSVVAYDYQDVGVLVSLFCIFHAGVGLVTPSLAKLRSMHVPNELRGGMISLSLAPANAVLLYFLVQRSYYHNIENSTMMAFAALGLFVAAGCMYLLKRVGKQPYQNWHKL